MHPIIDTVYGWLGIPGVRNMWVAAQILGRETFHSGQWRSQTNILEGQNIWGGPKCLIVGEQQYFVCDTVYQSPKWLDMLKKLKNIAPGTPGCACDSGSQNNLNLHFKFIILLLRQNECNHLLLCVLSYIKFRARKLILSLVVLKLIFT